MKKNMVVSIKMAGNESQEESEYKYQYENMETSMSISIKSVEKLRLFRHSDKLLPTFRLMLTVLVL